MQVKQYYRLIWRTNEQESINIEIPGSRRIHLEAYTNCLLCPTSDEHYLKFPELARQYVALRSDGKSSPPAPA